MNEPKKELTAEEQTKVWMDAIQQILTYQAPETQAVKLCRLFIDMSQEIVAEGDEWLVKWLRHVQRDFPRGVPFDLLKLVEQGEHWKWIRAERYKDG